MPASGPGCVMLLIVRFRMLLGAIALAAIACVSASAWRATGSVWNVIGYARGQCLFVDRATIDLGDVISGTPTSFEVVIRNASNSAAAIVGVTTSCACLKASAVPSAISPGTTARLEFELTPGKPNPAFELPATVITNAPGQFRIPLLVRGVIMASPSHDAVSSVLYTAAPLAEEGHAPADAAACSDSRQGESHAAR